MPRKNKSKISGYDIIVGIPSLNEADNISFVTQQVDWGLKKFFPEYKSLIINVDNNSPDGTKAEFLETKTKTVKKYITTPPKIVGKGNNFYNLFKEVEKQKAKAILVVDADLRSISPEWVKKMITPILNGYEYILPLYSRNEYDGTITNFICYPLLYGVLGYNIRQPIAGDFAFSASLNEYWLSRKWYPNTYQFGIDIFMTMHAVFGNFKLGQVILGSKIHKPSAPKLGIMFTEVVSTLFKNILHEKRVWQNNLELKKIPIISNGYHSEPQGLSIDYKNIKLTALNYFTEYQNIINRMLTPTVYREVKKMMTVNNMKINSALWQKIVFDSLLYYYKSHYNIKVIEAFKSLYFARVASYIKETLDYSYEKSEEIINSQAKLFFKNRENLIKRLK